MAYTGIWQDNLPWTDTERDRKFVGSAFIYTTVALILLVLLKVIPFPALDKDKIELRHVTFIEDKPKLIKEKPKPQQIAQKPKPKPKPKVKPKPKPKPKAKPKPKPKPKAKPKPSPKPKPKAKVKPKPKPKPQPSAQEIARKQAEREAASLDDLSDLREFDVATLDKNKPRQVTGQNSTNQGSTAFVGKEVNKGSDGINDRQYSRETGGGSLDGRNTTNVTSNLNSGSGGSRGGGGGSSSPERTFDEIELMFQNKKRRIYTFYQKARRNDPTLKGRIVLEITIQPSGKVSNVRIVSSELNNPALEKKIQSYVMRFKFKKLGVGVLKVTYPLDFLPS